MRVIAGKNKSIKLHTITGHKTRPTTDKVKESLFNIIGQRMDNYVVVDLFAGSGALGIEALSRGASTAFFIEKSINAINCIKQNLILTNNNDLAVVIKSDWQKAINNNLIKDQILDVVFVDPPYIEFKDKYQKIFELILDNFKLAHDAYIVFEHDTKLANELYSEEFLSGLINFGWQFKIYNYGSSSLTIFKK